MFSCADFLSSNFIFADFKSVDLGHFYFPFPKIECFLMDLQTFEEEIFKHSKLFLSIIAVQKVRAVEHAEIKEGILL